MSHLVRFDKFLCNLGYATRSTVMKFVRQNNVTVNGRRVRSQAEMVDPKDVLINDKPVSNAGLLTIMLHKPRGYVTSRKREAESKIIYDLLPPEFLKRKPTLVAAGRLDKWASGMVVMSQDHQLVQRVAAPKVKAGSLGKTYLVQLENDLSGTEAKVFASGKLVLRSETSELKPAKIDVVDPVEKLVKITLYEGRYHQIRRMLAAVGNKAISIHRVSVGPLSLGNLPVGQWRPLSSEELEAVWKANAKPSEKKPVAKATPSETSQETPSYSLDQAAAAAAAEVGNFSAQKTQSEQRKSKLKMEKLLKKREEKKFLRANPQLKESYAAQKKANKSSKIVEFASKKL